MMPGAGALGIVMQTTLKDCLLALWRLSQPAVLMTAKAEHLPVCGRLERLLDSETSPWNYGESDGKCEAFADFRHE